MSGRLIDLARAAGPVIFELQNALAVLRGTRRILASVRVADAGPAEHINLTRHVTGRRIRKTEDSPDAWSSRPTGSPRCPIYDDMSGQWLTEARAIGDGAHLSREARAVPLTDKHCLHRANAHARFSGARARPGSRCACATRRTCAMSRAASATSRTASGSPSCTSTGCCGPASSRRLRWPRCGSARATARSSSSSGSARASGWPRCWRTPGIKIDSVASELLGKSGRAMIEALIAGERNPARLADLALGRLRRKTEELQMACDGRFTVAHAQMCRLHLDAYDHLTAQIADLDKLVAEAAAPFAALIARLVTIPGVGQRTAEVIVAETGGDMTRFPTAARLAAWTGPAPGDNESAWQAQEGSHPQGRRAPAHRHGRSGLGHLAHRHPPRRPVPPPGPPVRQGQREEGRRGRRPHPAVHRLGGHALRRRLCPTSAPTSTSSATSATASTWSATTSTPCPSSSTRSLWPRPVTAARHQARAPRPAQPRARPPDPYRTSPAGPRAGSAGAAAPGWDPKFRHRRGISRVGARCASVLRWYRSLTLAVGCRRCCQPYELGPLAQQNRIPATRHAGRSRLGRKRLPATSRAVGGKPESAAVPGAGQPRKLGQIGIVRNSPARTCRPGRTGAYWGIS